MGDLLWVVPGRPISPTVVVGSVAAAATTGALVAIGHRLGSAGIPFAAISAVVHHSAATSATFTIISGLLYHAASVFLWGALCVQLARAFARRGLAAVLTAACQFTLVWLFAWSSGSGLATVVPLGDRIVYAVVLTGALVVGMRIAFSRPATRDRPLL